MAKEVFYRQCKYEQAKPPEGSGTKFDTAWLPEKLAKVGQIIYLGKKRGDVAQEELYRVISVGDNRRNGKWLTDKQNADSHQREASDV